jgi:DNA repair exonuclease SbcCD ATPase subunit
MKKFLVLASLIAAVGCSSSDIAPESAPAAPAPDPRAGEMSRIRAQIQTKRAELGQADQDLARIQAERRDLADQPASQQKTDRLVELARAESETKQKKNALTEDISDLQRELGEASPAAPAARSTQADQGLDAILAAAEGANRREKEEAERREAEARRRRMEEEAGAERRRIAAAETRRMAAEEARSKEPVAGGRPAEGPDGAPFEERWADVILQVRTELQRYKPW